MPGSVAGNDGVGHGLIVLAMLADEAGTRSLHTRVCAGAGLGGEVRLPWRRRKSHDLSKAECKRRNSRGLGKILVPKDAPGITTSCVFGFANKSEAWSTESTLEIQAGIRNGGFDPFDPPR